MKLFKLNHFYLALTTFALLGLYPSISANAVTFRSLDGGKNNLANPTWGQANTQLFRLLTPAYDDGISTPAGAKRPSPRSISNAVSSQSSSITNSYYLSDWFWQWGQFLDHDLDLTAAQTPLEPYNISVPLGDRNFDPNNTGKQEIIFNRSLYDSQTGTDANNPRQQINQVTSYIDASMVYGSDEERASFLRTNDDTGKLKTSAGELLPFNTAGLPNDGGNSSNLFIAGDIRVNENIGLTSVQTLFVREHNRLAEEIAAQPDLELKAAEAELSIGDYIYQKARKTIAAQIQVITYSEFLPLLLGKNALEKYTGYDETVNASISNEFSTTAFRFGHTMLSPELQLVKQNGAATESIALRDAFFNPQPIIEKGIEPLLLGLASQKAQELDTLLVDDVRNFLFGFPGAGGFDLAALNIQRGRDHGLPSYNQTRLGLGLESVESFAEITADLSVQKSLASVYNSVEDIDLWIGGLAEDPFNKGIVGETFNLIIAEQFLRLRDGDRFFYQNDPELVELVPELGSTKLSDIIIRNSTITEIQDDVFLVIKTVPEPSSIWGLLNLSGLSLVFFTIAKKRKAHS